jgi:hypothetical protein
MAELQAERTFINSHGGKVKFKLNLFDVPFQSEFPLTPRELKLPHYKCLSCGYESPRFSRDAELPGEVEQKMKDHAEECSPTNGER